MRTVVKETMARKKQETTTTDESVIVSAAKAIGTAAGKIASLAGVSAPAEPKRGKLPPKNKARLPRRQKKAKQKLEAAQQAK